MTDPIADMLSRIRNTILLKRSELVLPYSKLKFEIAKIFEKNGLVSKIELIEEPEKKTKQIRIVLKYLEGKNPVITHIKRISKPGRRVYVGRKEMPIVLNNYGLAIVSTSKGLMTNREAKRNKLGGEIICEIY